MAKKIDYSSLFTLRKDGRYQKVVDGKFLIDKDPERLLQKIQEANNPPPPKPILFDEVAEDWAANHFTRISFKTEEAYTAPLRRIKAHFKGTPIEEITSMQIQAYISDLSKRDYARRTVQMHLDIIRMIFNHAVLHGKLTVNPTIAVSMPSGLRSEKRDMPTDKEIEIIKASCDKTFGLFAFFLLYTGLRRGEALALTYDDIDFYNKIIRITKSVSFEGNTPKIKTPKTEAGVRDVILLDILHEKLNHNGKGLLFGRDAKNHLTKTQVRKRWIKYQQETGLTLTPHQLRHGFATICYDANIDEKAAQMLLGHSSILVTKNIYTHIRQSRVDNVAKTLNQYTSGKTDRVKYRVIKRKPRTDTRFNPAF